MGCAGGRSVATAVITSNKNSGSSQLGDIMKKFSQVMQSLPFWNLNIQKIKQITSSFQGTLDEYIDSLQDLDKFSKHLLKEVMTMAETKLKIIFPSDTFEEVTLLIFFLFMGKNNKKEFQTEKKNLLIILFKYAQDKSNISKYSSGKFSFLIINFLNYLCHILLYVPLMITLLQHFDQMNKLQIEKLIIFKSEVNGIKYEDLKEYFLKKLEIINPKIKPDSIMHCCLPYIFEPIKHHVISNSDEESVEITPKEMEEVFNRLFYFFDSYNLLDVCLTLKIKDY